MSIMDILGGAQPPQQGMPSQAPQGPPQGPPAEGPDAGDHSGLLRDILDMVRQAAQQADDEQEALTLEKVSTMMQQILAQQEKQDQELMQGKMNPAALRRALG